MEKKVDTMQAMQNAQNPQKMQNMFAFPAAPSPGEANVSESGEKEGSQLFASFLTSLTQAVEQADAEGNTASSGFLDLTFSAEQGEKREEYTTSLPLEGMSLFFSKPVLDLLASLKEDLGEVTEKGVDIDLISDLISRQVDEFLGESELDAERLESLLSRLRDRTVVTGDGSRRFDIEVALSENLKLGASLKRFQNKPGATQSESPQDRDQVEGQDEGQGEDGEDVAETITKASENAEALRGANANLLLPFFPPGEAEGNPDEKSADTPLLLPRLYGYLKPDATRPSSKMTRKTNSAPAEGEEKTPSDNVSGTVSPSYEAFSGKDSGNESSAAQVLSETKIQDKGPAPNRFVFDGFDGKAKSPQDKGTDAEVKTGSSDTAKFDQFFEGILSRRGSVRFDPDSLGMDSSGMDSLGEGLDLARETPLSRNEALREGLDNVVRFIRTSGEQKASLIVDPPALGRVSVELTSSATGLEASIKVGSEQIRQLVQDQLVQLRLTLAQQGVQLTQFSVDVQQDSGQRQQQQNTGQRRQFVEPGEEEEGQTVFRVDLDKGLLYWVA
ncbi:MAG: flagellar hook-length control protein FliK [Synergistaceae bacterium]|jgi:flagellar hook-length control protein FliK|nr:flagellar hook-length control protein FliK [Synergistaceae bacterium]